MSRFLATASTAMIINTLWVWSEFFLFTDLYKPTQWCSRMTENVFICFQLITTIMRDDYYCRCCDASYLFVGSETTKIRPNVYSAMSCKLSDNDTVCQCVLMSRLHALWTEGQTMSCCTFRFALSLQLHSTIAAGINQTRFGNKK